MWRLYFTSNTGYLGMARGESINLDVTECNEQAKKEAVQKALDYLAKRQERPRDGFREFAFLIWRG